MVESFVPFRFDLAEHVASFCWLSTIGLLLWRRNWAVVVDAVLSPWLLEDRENGNLAARSQLAGLGYRRCHRRVGLSLLTRLLLMGLHTFAMQGGVR